MTTPHKAFYDVIRWHHRWRLKYTSRRERLTPAHLAATLSRPDLYSTLTGTGKRMVEAAVGTEGMDVFCALLLEDDGPRYRLSR